MLRSTRIPTEPGAIPRFPGFRVRAPGPSWNDAMLWARAAFREIIKLPLPLSPRVPPMQTLPVNGTDMAFLDLGQGRPLLCVHGSLCDFRIWSAVLGPLTQHHRVIAVSLRHFFPERWDGVSDTYSIAQHVADVIAFIEKLDTEPVDLMGHSRG